MRPTFAATGVIGLLTAAVISTALIAKSAAQTLATRTGEAPFRAIYKEMVETDTSFDTGSCTTLIEKIDARMKAGGFPAENLHVFIPDGNPKAGALVAVYPGMDTTAKAVLMLGHIDVVNARRADWARDPFVMVEENGFFYGRGVADMKAQDAIYVDSLLRYRAQGYKPRRTIKMALTCGEEGLYLNGARWLVQNQRDLIDAGIAINEGGYGDLDEHQHFVAHDIEAAQKVGMQFTLETTNPGGHSARPRPDNAIYSLARALDRLSQHDFPVQFIDANKAYFTKMASVVSGSDSAAMKAIIANPDDKAASDQLNKTVNYHAMLRTTCVATMIAGGHAANALPQRATATINCRTIPGTKAEDVRAALVQWVADPEVKVLGGDSVRENRPPAPLGDKVLGPVQTVSNRIWPGVPVVPYLLPAATDSSTLNAAGIPAYGISGIFRDPDGDGLHGLNERIRVRSVLDGRDFLFSLVKLYADQKD